MYYPKNMKPVTRSKSMKVLYTGQKIVDRFLGFSMVSTNHLRSDNDIFLYYILHNLAQLIYIKFQSNRLIHAKQIISRTREILCFAYMLII